MPGFVKENKTFLIGLGLMGFAFIAGALFSEREEKTYTPGFLFEKVQETQSALGSPMITAKVIFDAIQAKDESKFQQCFLTEQEFNTLVNSGGSIFSKIADLSKAEVEISTYQQYRNHLMDKFNSIISHQFSADSIYHISLDSISEGEAIKVDNLELAMNLQINLAYTNELYEETSFRLVLPALVKTPDKMYKILL